ncbi:MAG: hypothetical protein JW811_05920 [Clostridiales bacterium]|nr:hypothetical protein [Clostridiales bacterium]
MKTMVIAALILLIVSVGLGIWMGIAGAPYNTALQTVHKLSSIGFAVLCVIYFVGETRKGGMAAGDIALAAVFVVSLIALLATGGIMSGKQEVPALLRIAHAASAVLIAAGSGWKLIVALLG